MVITSGAFKAILCLVDGTEEGCRAAERAACLARDLEGTVEYVVAARAARPSPQLEKYREMEGLDGVEIPLPPKEALDCLEQAKSIAVSCGYSHPKGNVLVGSGAEVVVERTKNSTVDLLIVGHRSRRLGFGISQSATLAKVIERLAMPVMLVP